MKIDFSQLKETIVEELMVEIKKILKPIDSDLDETLTVQEAADYFKVTPVTIHAYAKKGILIKHKIGRRTIFKREEVLAASQKIEAKRW